MSSLYRREHLSQSRARRENWVTICSLWIDSQTRWVTDTLRLARSKSRPLRRGSKNKGSSQNNLPWPFLTPRGRKRQSVCDPAFAQGIRRKPCAAELRFGSALWFGQPAFVRNLLLLFPWRWANRYGEWRPSGA